MFGFRHSVGLGNEILMSRVDVGHYLPKIIDRLVPETIPFKHSCEGPDDMPAHAKACLLGSNLTLPICEGRVTLGTWQGVWLCEHR